jgi:SAM-dependent methyltransferase
MLAQARRSNRRAVEQGRVELRQGRFDELPFRSETIDKILAVNVVYFFSPDGKEMRECRRVLRPGGTMAIYATHRTSMSRWRFAGQETHSLFDEKELGEAIRRGGFPADEISVVGVNLGWGVKGLLATVHKRNTADQS